MSKIPGMTGVPIPQSHPGLSPEAKQSLAEILQEKVKEEQKIAVLLEDIDYAVRNFHSSRELQTNTSPAEVRARLKETTKAVLALGKCLNSLDGQTLWLLHHSDGQSPVSRMRVELSFFLGELRKASKLAAGSRSRGGRLPDIPMRLLVAQIAYLLRTQTSIKPTASVDGVFEKIIRVVVASIEGTRKRKRIDPNEKSVHDLALRGLKVKVTVHDGGVEFDPWVE